MWVCVCLSLYDVTRNAPRIQFFLLLLLLLLFLSFATISTTARSIVHHTWHLCLNQTETFEADRLTDMILGSKSFDHNCYVKRKENTKGTVIVKRTPYEWLHCRSWVEEKRSESITGRKGAHDPELRIREQDFRSASMQEEDVPLPSVSSEKRKKFFLQKYTLPLVHVMETCTNTRSLVSYSPSNISNSSSMRNNEVRTVMLHGVPIVALVMDGLERLCLAQISNTLLKNFSYNEIHNR